MCDVDHDLLQLRIDFLECPGKSLGVLAHLKSGGGDAAGVRSLARCEDHAVLLQILGSIESGRHICAFADSDAAVLDQLLGALKRKLVLGCARQIEICLDVPDALALVILCARTGSRILGEARTLNFLDLLEECNIDSVRIINPAGGIGAGHRLRAKLLSLLDRVCCDVAGTRDSHCLAGNVDAVDLEEFLCEVKETVTGSLCSCERAAVGKALAGQNAFVKVRDSLVLAVEITDLAGAYADIAGRDVLVSADVFVELCHEGLAETHDLVVGLALGIKIGAALAAADRKACQAVLEDLLEAQELDDTDINRRMKTKASLVRADRAVELDAVAAVDLNISFVIDPRNAEHDDSLRLGDSLKER